MCVFGTREGRARSDRNQGKSPIAEGAHSNPVGGADLCRGRKKSRRKSVLGLTCSPLLCFSSTPCLSATSALHYAEQLRFNAPAHPRRRGRREERGRRGRRGRRSEEAWTPALLALWSPVLSPLLALHGRGWGEPDAVAAGLSASPPRLRRAASGHCLCCSSLCAASPT